MSTSTTAQRLQAIVERAPAALRRIDPDDAARQPGPGKWSMQQVLGHLIDSATHNHDRFVRALLEDEPRFAGYDQEGWVRVQAYGAADWSRLVDLWTDYNLHLSRLIAAMPSARLDVPCRIDDAPPVTLAQLTDDYVQHLLHHMQQIAPEIDG